MTVVIEETTTPYEREVYEAVADEAWRTVRRFDGAVRRMNQFKESGPHFSNCTPIKCMCAIEHERWDNASDNIADMCNPPEDDVEAQRALDKKFNMLGSIR